MFASSLLIRFSSNSLARALRKSDINCTNPRIFELFPELPLLKKFEAAAEAMVEIGSRFLELSDQLGTKILLEFAFKITHSSQSVNLNMRSTNIKIGLFGFSALQMW
jgi:hypothetical protein